MTKSLIVFDKSKFLAFLFSIAGAPWQMGGLVHGKLYGPVNTNICILEIFWVYHSVPALFGDCYFMSIF